MGLCVHTTHKAAENIAPRVGSVGQLRFIYYQTRKLVAIKFSW